MQIQLPDPFSHAVYFNFKNVTLNRKENRTMTKEIKKGTSTKIPEGTGVGYAFGQLAKALPTKKTHENAKIRANAQKKTQQWQQVLHNLWTEEYHLGSRTPLQGVPSWVTLEVVQGGFATGNCLAGGELLDFEKQLLTQLKADCHHNSAEDARRWLNSYFLTETGLASLDDLLTNHSYQVNLPEETALLTVAWLLTHDRKQQAKDILDAITPFFSKLRFYPKPTQSSQTETSLVHLNTIADTLENLTYVAKNDAVATQKTQVSVWIPFYDRVIACFIEASFDTLVTQQLNSKTNNTNSNDNNETIKDDAFSAHVSNEWQQQVTTLVTQFKQLKKQHKLVGKFAKKSGHHADIFAFLGQLAEKKPITLGQLKRIEHILACYINKRGKPTSEQCTASRELQLNSVAKPLHYDIAQVVLKRFEPLPNKHQGIDSVMSLLKPITPEEAKYNQHNITRQVPENTQLPNSLVKKIKRCENQSLTALVETGQISSSEQLASVLPQVTSDIKAVAIADPVLRRVFSQTYQAFRKRRSLLLFNLEKQVQLNELPWVKAIDNLKSDTLASKTASKDALKQIASLALIYFPHTILPNTLLQEVNALAHSAGEKLPLTEELAVDIFMGAFSPKYTEAVIKASHFMQGSLYARYYGIDYVSLREELQAPKKSVFNFVGKKTCKQTLAELCAKRAGQTLGGWDTAVNGMIVEQQQVLTTQNLALVCQYLKLLDSLPLLDMAKKCFLWCIKRLQANSSSRHAKLISIKNTAYAWRQMLFYLSFISQAEQQDFMSWATAKLSEQNKSFISLFTPALEGLSLVQSGLSFDDTQLKQKKLQPLLGWTTQNHWLMA